MTSLLAIEKKTQDGPAEDRAALRRIMSPVVVATVAFVLTAAIWEWLGNRLQVRPNIPEPLSTKINLCLDAQNVDTVFIGSSRFNHGLDPATFDMETARHGIATHSYNLSFDAMNFPELEFVCRHVLSDARSHFKYLILEPAMRVRLAPTLKNAQRAILLHDTQGSQEIFNLILRGNHDWQHKLFWIYEHASLSVLRLASVGAFTNHYIHPQEPPPDRADLVGPAGDGFSGLDPKTRGERVTAEDIQRMLKSQEDRDKSGKARVLNAFEIHQLTELQTLAEARGATVVLIAPPTAADEMYGEFAAVSRASRKGMLKVPMLSFADPVTYFDLYDPDGFVDPDHIAKPVAEQWTRKAAEAFAKLVRSEAADADDDQSQEGAHR